MYFNDDIQPHSFLGAITMLKMKYNEVFSYGGWVPILKTLGKGPALGRENFYVECMLCGTRFS